jgi:hypothetical protein
MRSAPSRLPAEPRRIGLIWSRASPRLRLITAFREEALARLRQK